MDGWRQQMSEQPGTGNSFDLFMKRAVGGVKFVNSINMQCMWMMCECECIVDLAHSFYNNVTKETQFKIDCL